MGVDSNSIIFNNALSYIRIRSFGAPAVLLILSIEGIFRGLADSKSCLFGTLISVVIHMTIAPYLVRINGIQGLAYTNVIGEVSILFFYILLLSIKLKTVFSNNSNSNNNNNNNSNSNNSDENILEQRYKFRSYFSANITLLLKNLSLMFTWSLLSSKASRMGVENAACHQIMVSTWGLLSVLSDSLSISAQVILPRITNTNTKSIKTFISEFHRICIKFSIIQLIALLALRPVIPTLYHSDHLQDIGKTLLAGSLAVFLSFLAIINEGVLLGKKKFNYLTFSIITSSVLTTILVLLTSSMKYLTSTSSLWLCISGFFFLRSTLAFININSSNFTDKLT